MGFFRQFMVLSVFVLLMVGSAWAQGMLRYAGATTLQRYFMPEVARIFTAETGIKVNIEGGNSGAGIKALLEGDVDMAGSGRFLTAAEKQQGLVEHFLGWDILAIVVHENNPIETLSLEQLQGIFSGELTNWQQVGGLDQPIVVVTSSLGSGMRSAVQKLILHDKTYLHREIVSAIVAASDQQVSMFPAGITALSRSMLDAEHVKMVNVGGFAATKENVSTKKYPLGKPLLLVTRGEPQGALDRFLSLVKSPKGQGVLQKSFVPAD
jgi:phosphate transport system substrate-binding protein